MAILFTAVVFSIRIYVKLIRHRCKGRTKGFVPVNSDIFRYTVLQNEYVGYLRPCHTKVGHVSVRYNLADYQDAYVVVIPVRPTGGNIESFTRTVALVKENTNCPIIVAVNGVNRFTASVSFMEWLQKYRQKEHLDTVLTIPQSEVLVQAENCRCSVNEINKHSPATQAVNDLCSEISYLAKVPVQQQPKAKKSKKLVAK